MSIEQWKQEALDIGLNKPETKDYVLKKQKEQALALERERQREKEAHELAMHKLTAEREKEKEAHELKLAELRAQNVANGDDNGNRSQAPALSVHRLKLAPFKESDKIEIFISRFEEAAQVMRYDDATKRIQFMSLFEGQALEVIHRLDENAREYVDMKEALLAAYGMSVDELKKQFFTAAIKDDETAVQFAARLKGYFDQWRRKDGVEDTVEGIKDLILRAQYVKSCPSELVTRLKMDKVNSLDGMKEMANSYFEACGRKKKPEKSNNAQAEPTEPARGVVNVGGDTSRPWSSPRNNNFHGSGTRQKVGNYGSYFKQGYNHSWKPSQRQNFERRPTAHAQAPSNAGKMQHS